jgi:subtilisin family serine protease
LLAAAPARALKTETFQSGIRPAAGGTSIVRVTSGQALVELAVGTSTSSLTAPLAAAGAVYMKDLGSRWILVGWSDGSPVASKLTSLAALPGVAAVSPSHVFSVKAIPNDPFVTSQYALAKVDAFRGWEFETGYSSRVTIAVIDTGIDGSHPDLADKLANTTSLSYDPNCGAAPCAATTNNPPTPACEHATEVSGVAAASTNNSLDVAGMSWGAQLVSLKVFADADCNSDCTDAGSNLCDTNDPAIISAIEHAASLQNTAAYGRIVVNMSLGGTPTSTCAADDPALQTAVTNAVTAGVVLVAAAGNDGGPVNSPGYCTGVIPVGATDMNDDIASFSSNGSVLASNGLVAPGVSLTSLVPGGGTTSNASGTSFASPMVAGTAALMLSAKPSLSPGDVQSDLRSAADNIGQPPNNQGGGRLDVYKTLGLVVNGAIPAPNGVDANAEPFAFPNPVRLSQTSGVEFSIPPGLGTSGLDIRVYTMQGGFVRELSAPLWDGRNAGGNLVASGSYVFVVKTSAGSARGRLAVIR